LLVDDILWRRVRRRVAITGHSGWNLYVADNRRGKIVDPYRDGYGGSQLRPLGKRLPSGSIEASTAGVLMRSEKRIAGTFQSFYEQSRHKTLKLA